MRRIKQAAVATGILGGLAVLGAVLGPFLTGEAVAAVFERVRRGLPRRKRSSSQL